MAKKPTPATTEQKNDTVQQAPAFVPKVKRVITLPKLALGLDMNVYVKIMQTFSEGRPTGNKPDDDAIAAGVEQPREVQVTDLRTGQLMALTIGHSLWQILSSAYPDDSYVGLGFDIMRTKGKRGRTGTTNEYRVAELDLS